MQQTTPNTNASAATTAQKRKYHAKLMGGNAATTRIWYSYRGYSIIGRFSGSGSSRTVSAAREWSIEGVGASFKKRKRAMDAVDAIHELKYAQL